MSRLLPGRPDPVSDDRGPTMLALDDDRADEVFDALGSETARTIFQSLHAEPRPPSELTEEVETTLQNVQYHLTKLEAADLVTVVDTWYGQNGAEMDVYAPTDEALVLFAGDEPEPSLRSLLDGLGGALAVLAAGALAVGFGYSRFDPAPLVDRRVALNASTEYTAAADPATAGPAVLAAAFVVGGVVALSAFLAIRYFRRP
ncbi:MAG: ArsR/SmtB family transcription factor [Halorhabdus sp.]